MIDEDVKRLLEEEKDKQAKDYASVISKLVTRLAATETMSLQNQSNLSSMGRTQLSTISPNLRVERENIRG